MINFTTIEKYAILNVLSHIMKADGIINPREEEFMDQVYRDFDITIHNLEDISNIDDIQTKHIVSGMADEKKALARTLFIAMAKADGFIHPKEIEIIDHIFM